MRPLNQIRVLLGKLVLNLYRWLGIVVLYGVLALIGGYTVVLIFYAFNSTWIAPFIVTPTNDKILDMTGKLVMSQQSLNAMLVDRDRLQGGLGNMRHVQSTLEKLDTDLHTAIERQNEGNRSDAPDLDQLNVQKRADNVKTQQTLHEIETMEQEIKRDEAAGLITKADAAQARVQLQKDRDEATDGNISEVLLRDTIRQKTPQYTSTVDALAKDAELHGNIVQLTMEIKAGEEQLISDKTQITILQSAIELAKDSPYFLATKNNVKFAFVPYDNADNVKEGAKVYGCYLNMVICHNVGTIKHIFKDEEKTTHPIFRTDMRGFLVQLDMNDAEAAKAKVLFIGHKPLLF
jgi:hypothetical protein